MMFVMFGLQSCDDDSSITGGGVNPEPELVGCEAANLYDWASVEFEVVESNPENPSYPQTALFDMFKNGEHIKYAVEFEQMNPIGTEVSVEFNLKKNTYTKNDGTEAVFYKTSAWKVEKVGAGQSQDEPQYLTPEEDDSLPF